MRAVSGWRRHYFVSRVGCGGVRDRRTSVRLTLTRCEQLASAVEIGVAKWELLTAAIR